MRTCTVMSASLSPEYTYRDLFFIANSLRVLTRLANPTCMLVHYFFNALSGVEFFDYAKNLESHRRSIFFSSDDWTNSHPVLHIFNMVTEQNVIASLVFGLIFSCSILLFLGTGRDGERGQLMDLN